MRIKAISIAVVAPLVAVIVVGVLKIPLAAAQVEATSTESSSTSTEPTSTDIDATGTALSDTTSTSSSSTPAAESAPQELTLVHIIGTKYIDYFTDGTNTYTFPGDPEIHAHIADKDAPIPTHEGLTWVHSTGQYLYDTASGDLEVGQYALQLNGTFIQKAHPFVSATSSAAATVPESGPATTTTSSDDVSISTASSPSDTEPSTAVSDADTTPADQTVSTSSSTQ